MARPKEVIGRTTTPGGQELTLTTDGDHYYLTFAGTPLMSSLAHFSEEHLAEVGCQGLQGKPNARVLVGGLGMGYTLRAALDRISPTGRVVVSEFLPAVVEWNRGPLADLAGRPLEDTRTLLEVGDIVAYVRKGPKPFDAILLDTDNGPDDFTAEGNAQLYDALGLARLQGLLRPGGRLVVWSAYQCPSFVRDLRAAGYEPEVVRAKARGHKGGRHTLYVGRRPDSERPRRSARPTRRRR